MKVKKNGIFEDKVIDHQKNVLMEMTVQKAM